jgi:hypothetical protein
VIRRRRRADLHQADMSRLLERTLIVVVSLAVSIGVIALLSGGLLAGRDDPGVAGGVTGPGTAYRDQGDMHLNPGELHPVYDSAPPTSGPHVSAPVTRDGIPLSSDQLLTALEVGDVVLLYGDPRAAPALDGLAQRVAGRFSPALAASGGAVIVAPQPGTAGVTALAWAHMLRTGGATDPALHGFAEFWLGRGVRQAAGGSSTAGGSAGSSGGGGSTGG